MTDNQPEKGTTEKTTPAKSPRAPKNCGCLTGTGKTCPKMTSKSFAQGHDARMSSRVATDIAKDELSMEDGLALIRKAGGSDLLVFKTQRSAELRKEQASKPPKEKATKPAKEKATKPAKASKSAAKDAGEDDLESDDEDDEFSDEPETEDSKLGMPGDSCKVMHGERGFKGVLIRDESKGIVAAHRFQGKECRHDEYSDVERKAS